MSDTTTITKEALAWLLKDEESGRVVLVDVREQDEVDRGALEGAVHVPLTRLEKEIEALVPNKRARIVVYCAKGSRSAVAQSKLLALGYRRALSLARGYDGWTEDDSSSPLSAAEKIRYARQLVLPSFGTQAQEKLRAARVLIVGLGGLGSPVALYLAAAGVGTLGVVDADDVELSNLHRQLLHTTPRVGQSKVLSAKRALAELNPHVQIIPHVQRFDADTGRVLAAEYDLLIDGADNFAARYAVSDAACTAGVPVVHGSVHRFEGQLAVLLPALAAAKRGLAPGPCYRCIFPEPPKAAQSCEEAGVLGSICGVVGSLMATEALKLLSGIAPTSYQRLTLYDAGACELRSVAVSRRPSCRCAALPP